MCCQRCGSVTPGRWGTTMMYHQLSAISASNQIKINHYELGELYLAAEGNPDLLFCGNETNTKRFNNFDDGKRFYKDGINDHIIHDAETVNPEKTGTKAAPITISASRLKESYTMRLRLSDNQENGFADFDNVFANRKARG
jgi:hypothetical protein